MAVGVLEKTTVRNEVDRVKCEINKFINSRKTKERRLAVMRDLNKLRHEGDITVKEYYGLLSLLEGRGTY